MTTSFQKQKEIQLISPKDLTWEAVRARTSHWISDFEFFQFEVVFLQHLLARTTMWARVNEGDSSINDLQMKLNNLEMRRDLFARVMRYHRNQVEALIENPFAHDGQAVKDDHKDLEKRVIEFMKDFRRKKYAVYFLIEGTVDSEKISHLLDSNAERYLIEYE